MAEEIAMKVIARIHTDFPEKFGIPRQSGLIEELKSTIVFEPEFRDANALRGLEEYSHLWLIWEFSEAVRDTWSPMVRPPRLGGNKRVGVFATRSPFRPNPIGLSSVKLEYVEQHPSLGPVLHLTGADLMDGTPILASQTDYPIHIGITEAGTLERGKVKSAIGIGALLLAGIGDTMRVSLTADPVEEVIFAKEILRNVGLRKAGIDLVSCPTCGRTKVDLQALAAEVERRLLPLSEKLEKSGERSLKVAVMGCAVNGPGEAKEADFGICGGDGRGLLFSKGEIVKAVSEDLLVDELIKMIEANI